MGPMMVLLSILIAKLEMGESLWIIYSSSLGHDTARWKCSQHMFSLINGIELWHGLGIRTRSYILASSVHGINPLEIHYYCTFKNG